MNPITSRAEPATENICMKNLIATTNTIFGSDFFLNMETKMVGLCVVCMEFNTLQKCPCGGGAYCSNDCFSCHWENGHKTYCPVATRAKAVHAVLRDRLPRHLVRDINRLVGK